MAPPHHRQHSQQRHSDPLEDTLSFGAWLRQRRRALDWTQAELAQRVGCARITIRRIEADELKPSQQLAELFAEHLGVPPTQQKRWLQFARGLAPMPQSHPIDLPATPLGLPTNLPAPITTFLGRDHESIDGCRLVTTSRLLTLTGVGGAGKTRLALEMARALVNQWQPADTNSSFPDGIWWVELAPLTDAALIPETVAKVLGLREQPGQSMDRLLAEALKTKRMLLLLDNCEHLVAACAAWVHEWLHHCPHLHILATSREPLQLLGEQRFPVAPLLASSAGELFIQRAQLVNPSFTRTVANGAAIDQLCQQVDYLPLAIELLAARCDLFSPQAMLERLQARPLDLLSAEMRNLPARQRTLRRTIQHSYALLTEREQALFRTLGVFVGGFDLAAVAHFGFDENILQALIRKNLVQVQPSMQQEQRFFLLETLREFALERLAESGELQRIQERHADFYVILVEEAELQHRGLQQKLWLERLERELDNLRVARQWSLYNNAETSLRLAGSLAWFWEIRGYFQEGREWLEQILATNCEVSLSFRAKALYAAGILAWRQGDYKAARAWLESSTALRPEIGNHRIIAAALVHLANIQTSGGHYEAAGLLIQESLTIFRALDDKRGSADSLAGLGAVALGQSDYSLATKYYQEAVAIARQNGDKVTMTHWLRRLADIAWHQGNHLSARSHYQEALCVGRETGDVGQISSALTSLGYVVCDEGNYESARALFEEALLLRRKVGDKRGVSITLNGLGETAYALGDTVVAHALYTESLAIKREIGDRLGIAITLNNLGKLASDQGEYDTAHTFLAQSSDLYLALQDKNGMSRAQCNLAEVLTKQGERAKAIALYQASLITLWALRARRAITICFDGLARLAVMQEQLERATHLFSAAAILRESIGISPPPVDSEVHWNNLATIRTHLGDNLFEQAWIEGQAMTLDEAVAYALTVEYYGNLEKTAC